MPPDGRTLFISAGERQQFQSAQDPAGTLGKIVRLNPYGLAGDDCLCESELRPVGSDEFNLI